MNSNIITLDNMKDIPIDEIIALYKNGYVLDESYKHTTLQGCPSGCTPEYYTAIYGYLGFFSGIVVGLIVAYLVTPKEKDIERFVEKLEG